MNDHTTNDRSFIERLHETIARHLENGQFGVEMLASEMGVSKSQLQRKLHQSTNKSASQLIRETRLQKAKELLANKEYSAAEVAYMVGFSSPTYFSTRFHEFYGYTPGEAKGREYSGSKKKFLSKKSFRMSIGIVLLLVVIYATWRFKHGPEKESSEAKDANTLAEPPNPVSERSVVVLSFENLSNAPEQEYFCKGMVDEIRTRLFMIGGLIVKSDTLVVSLGDPEIAHEDIGIKYGTSYILGGSVRKAGDEVRIIPQLIDAKTGMLIWSDIYDGNLQEVSKLLSFSATVAEKVASNLSATITAEETERMYNIKKSTNPLAYLFYLQGLDYWNSKRDRILALEMFSKAIEEDPSFASAYARRAIMHARTYYSKNSDNWLEHDQLTVDDIKKTNQLDSGSIDAMLAQSIYHYYIDRDFERAITILEELKQYAPAMADLYAYSAYIKRCQGKWTESIEELNKAMELEPLNVVYINNQCENYLLVRDFDMALEIVMKGQEKIPDYDPFRRRLFSTMMSKTGDFRLALEVSGLTESDVPGAYYSQTRQFDKLIEYVINKNRGTSTPRYYHPTSYPLALNYQYLGDTVISKVYADSTIHLLENKMKENPLDHRLAAPLSSCYAILGDREKAMKYIQIALNQLPKEADWNLGLYKEREVLRTYIFLGEYDLVFDKIEYLLSIPAPYSVGMLWSQPLYYELRNHPRFQEVLRKHQFEPPDDNLAG